MQKMQKKCNLCSICPGNHVGDGVGESMVTAVGAVTLMTPAVELRL